MKKFKNIKYSDFKSKKNRKIDNEETRIII